MNLKRKEGITLIAYNCFANTCRSEYSNVNRKEWIFKWGRNIK